MRATEIKSCYLGPQISPEQFIAEHFFLFLIKGAMLGYDGNRNYTLNPGEYCIVRKNHLARYNKQKVNDEFEKVIIIFDELFLKSFKEKYRYPATRSSSKNAFIALQKDELIPGFIRSLIPYYKGAGKIDPLFSEIKREELLLILLKTNPELKNVLFDFGMPGKINIKEFMNRNYKFNVKVERLAYLTGRSLSAFKRDFKMVFDDTPNQWLVQKRLQEAHFLIEKKNKKPSDIYLELGFEDLSHFSFVFKKHFGYPPSQLTDRKKNSNKHQIAKILAET